MSSILTVSQLSKYIRFKLQGDPKLKGVAVKGELVDYNLNYRSGHAYFSLRDEEAVVRCVMFASSASRLRFSPENGMSILAVGSVDIYEKSGTYQIIVTELAPLGAAEARVGLEQLKRKLSEQGVFDPAKKKPIPQMPRKIAIVTSLNGAAVKDVINVLSRRFPIVEAEIFPATVQGSEAAASIASALARADRSGADTLILTRGGGSDDELSVFNDERVIMAVYNCSTPVISAVGHEIDTFLCDYAADLRAPTPSAAAELAVPELSVLTGAYDLLARRLTEAMMSRIEREERAVTELGAALAYASPQHGIETSMQTVDSLLDRLNTLMESRLRSEGMKLDKFAAQLAALSPFGILGRGYTITAKDGSAVSSVSGLREGDSVNIIFADGSAGAEITRVNKNEV
ncbi:MAG: exodeoxyribonuclease VII large subunit [Ruminococcus sp.]|nr:exodeoxyribonuclease VII large subunit [Ruminococcus sp.]